MLALCRFDVVIEPRHTRQHSNSFLNERSMSVQNCRTRVVVARNKLCLVVVLCSKQCDNDNLLVTTETSLSIENFNLIRIVVFRTKQHLAYQMRSKTK